MARQNRYWLNKFLFMIKKKLKIVQPCAAPYADQSR